MTGRFVASKRRESQQAGGFSMREKVYSDILPHFGVTSYLAHRDILPSHFRDLLPRPLSPLACLPARRLPGRPAGQHDLQRRLNRIRQEAVARPPGVHRNGGWHCR